MEQMGEALIKVKSMSNASKIAEAQFLWNKRSLLQKQMYGLHVFFKPIFIYRLKLNAEFGYIVVVPAYENGFSALLDSITRILN